MVQFPTVKDAPEKEVLIVSPPQTFLGLASPRVKFAPPQLPWTNAQPVLKSFRFAAMKEALAHLV